MAKTKIVEEGVETPIVETEAPAEVETASPEVPAARQAEEVKETPSKKVKIRVSENVNCYVSNIPYHLEKDKTYQVPADVAAILVNSGKAYRI